MLVFGRRSKSIGIQQPVRLQELLASIRQHTTRHTVDELPTQLGAASQARRRDRLSVLRLDELAVFTFADSTYNPNVNTYGNCTNHKQESNHDALHVVGNERGAKASDSYEKLSDNSWRFRNALTSIKQSYNDFDDRRSQAVESGQSIDD